MSKLSIHHIDVGQGDSTLITLTEKIDQKNVISKAILIDVGASEETTKRAIEFCQFKLKTVRLTEMIFSHMCIDHIGGKGGQLPLLLRTIISSDTCIYATHPGDEIKTYFGCISNDDEREIQDYNKWMNAHLNKDQMSNESGKHDKATNGPYLCFTGPGQIIKHGALTIKFIAANQRSIGNDGTIQSCRGSGTTPNNLQSLALIIQHGAFTYYTAGDLHKDQETTLVRDGQIPELNALKISHHGSAESTPVELLQRCRQPYPAIITTGYNKFEHPRLEIIERIKQSRGDVYATGLIDATEVFDHKRKRYTTISHANVKTARKENRSEFRIPGVITIRHEFENNFIEVSRDVIVKLSNDTNQSLGTDITCHFTQIVAAINDHFAIKFIHHSKHAMQCLINRIALGITETIANNNDLHQYVTSQLREYLLYSNGITSDQFDYISVNDVIPTEQITTNLIKYIKNFHMNVDELYSVINIQPAPDNGVQVKIRATYDDRALMKRTQRYAIGDQNVPVAAQVQVVVPTPDFERYTPNQDRIVTQQAIRIETIQTRPRPTYPPEFDTDDLMSEDTDTTYQQDEEWAADPDVEVEPPKKQSKKNNGN